MNEKLKKKHPWCVGSLKMAALNFVAHDDDGPLMSDFVNQVNTLLS